MRRISLGRLHFQTAGQAALPGRSAGRTSQHPRARLLRYSRRTRRFRGRSRRTAAARAVELATPSMRTATNDDVLALQGWKGFAWTRAIERHLRAAQQRRLCKPRVSSFISAGERSAVEQNLLLIGVLFIPHGQRVVFFLFEYCCAGHVKTIAMDETRCDVPLLWVARVRWWRRSPTVGSGGTSRQGMSRRKFVGRAG